MKLNCFYGFFLIAPALLIQATLSSQVGLTTTLSTTENPHHELRQDQRTCTHPAAANGTVKSMYNLNKNYGWFMMRELHTPGQACGSNPNFSVRKSWLVLLDLSSYSPVS
jgi:hypothetical protein